MTSKIKPKGRLRKLEQWTPLTPAMKHVLLNISFVRIKASTTISHHKGWVTFTCDLHDRDVTKEISMLYGRRLIEMTKEDKRTRYVATSMELWRAALDDSLYAMM